MDISYYLGGSPPQVTPSADVVSSHSSSGNRRNFMDEFDYSLAHIADDPESFERNLNVLMAALG